MRTITTTSCFLAATFQLLNSRVAALCAAFLFVLTVSLANQAHAVSLHYVDTVLADNPSAYWRLGEPSGATADNAASATTTRDGTYSGFLGGDYGQTGPNSGGGFLGFGAVNNAGRFTNGSVSVPSGFLPTGASARTYEFWFNADSVTPAAQALFSHGVNLTGQRINITASNSSLAIAVNGNNHGTTSLSLSGWNHVAIALPLSATLSN